MQRQNSIEINLPYKLLQQSYSVEDIDSYTGVVNAKQLVESIEEVIGVIFDENIRLAEVKSKVNDGIKSTAADKDSAMFYFYNNGITFICDSINISPNSLSANLKGASIVNGCQTVTSLYENYNLDKLNDDVDLLVRVTKISDYDERAKITQFLNTQNQIKESYFLSNHTIIRDLQSKLLSYGYYLERQINEATYKERYVDESIKKDKTIIKLDDVIQYYSGYYLDKFAAVAKRNKASLYSPDIKEEILSEITPEKVITSYKMYQTVSDVITTYRRQRRNKENEEFANLLGIENSELDKDEYSYLFVNTADILLLNTSKHILEKDKGLSKSEAVIQAIKTVREIISSNEDLKSMAPASLTKNQKIFTEVKNRLTK